MMFRRLGFIQRTPLSSSLPSSTSYLLGVSAKQHLNGAFSTLSSSPLATPTLLPSLTQLLNTRHHPCYPVPVGHAFRRFTSRSSGSTNDGRSSRSSDSTSDGRSTRSSASTTDDQSSRSSDSTNDGRSSSGRSSSSSTASRENDNTVGRSSTTTSSSPSSSSGSQQLTDDHRAAAASSSSSSSAPSRRGRSSSTSSPSSSPSSSDYTDYNLAREMLDFDRLFGDRPSRMSLTNRDHSFLDLPLMPFHEFGHTGGRQQMCNMTLDVIAKKDQLLVNAEAPGMRKEDIKINVDGDILTIQGEKHASNFEQGDQFVRREISSGSVMRSIRLPPDCQPDKISAKFDQGMLHIAIPRTESAKSSKRRDVKID